MGAAQTQGFRILGVFTPSRVADAPDAPTMTEQGIPVVAQVFGGLYAPKGLSGEAMTTLQSACQDAVRSERYVSAAKASQQEVLFRPADAFNKALAAEHDNLGQTIRKANLKLN